MYAKVSQYPVGYEGSSSSIRSWQKDVAYNLGDQTHRQPEPPAPRIVVNNISTAPAVESRRRRSDYYGDPEISTRAIIGTLLGASAGAAVAYAMAKSEGEKGRVAPERQTRPQGRITEVIYTRADPASRASGPIRMIDYEADKSSYVGRNTANLSQTVSTSARRSSMSASRADCRTIVQTNGTRILACDASHDHRLSQTRASKATPTIVSSRSVKAHESVHSGGRRSAKDVPLPASRVSASMTSASRSKNLLLDCKSVVPDDSISQVSTKRSSNHHRKSEHQHSHSKGGHSSKSHRRSSHGSGRTIKGHEHGSTMNSQRR